MGGDIPDVIKDDPRIPPEHLNPVQKALYQKLMATTGLLLAAGFAVNDVLQMVKSAAALQRSKE